MDGGGVRGGAREFRCFSAPSRKPFPAEQKFPPPGSKEAKDSTPTSEGPTQEALVWDQLRLPDPMSPSTRCLSSTSLKLSSFICLRLRSMKQKLSTEHTRTLTPAWERGWDKGTCGWAGRTQTLGRREWDPSQVSARARWEMEVLQGQGPGSKVQGRPLGLGTQPLLTELAEPGESPSPSLGQEVQGPGKGLGQRHDFTSGSPGWTWS